MMIERLLINLLGKSVFMIDLVARRINKVHQHECLATSSRSRLRKLRLLSQFGHLIGSYWLEL